MVKKKERENKVKKKAGKNSREEKIPTGIKNFDKLIEGGFEKDSTNLIIGGSGSGKSIFSVQFLIEGLKRGESCLYITFEEKKGEFYKNMKDFGWDLAAYEKKGRFVFLEYTPEKVKTMLEEGGGMIESIVLRKKINRIVIDSITSFEILFDEDIKKREAALALFGMLRRWECTSLLTYEGNPFRSKRATSRALEFESDSIILMYFPRTRKERERFIEILKMRGVKHSLEVYKFTIDKNGINIGRKAGKKDLG